MNADLNAGSYISKRFGRTMTMSVAGMAFLVGMSLLYTCMQDNQQAMF